MKVKLKNIASIQTGYSFRSRLEPEPEGNVAIIQMKDLSENNQLDNKGLTLIQMADLEDRHQVKPKDLVFRSRGLNHTAALVDPICEIAILAAPLLRIRVNQNLVLPTYLCWFINQPLSQAILKSKAEGSFIKMISKTTLAELEIWVPTLEIQERIVLINELAQEEQRLIKELSQKKRNLTDELLIQFASRTQELNN